MKYYYDKKNDSYISTDGLISFNSDIIEISEEEYLDAITMTEEEIREAKEAQLRALMAELYPPEGEG